VTRLTAIFTGRPLASRGARLRAAAASVLTGVALLLAPGSASAVVNSVEFEGKPVTFGMQPRSIALGSPGAPVGTFDNPQGHPVMHSSSVYAIYWDPEYLYNGDWEHLIDTFLQSAGAESGSLGKVYGVDEQYTDRSNMRAAYKTTFRGAYTDTKPYPTGGGCIDPDLFNSENHQLAQLDNVACLTDKQLREELQAFIAKNSLKTGMGTIFYLLTPPGVTVCADGGGTSGHCSDFTWQLTTKPLKLGEEEPNPESYEHSFCSYHADISTSPVEGDEATIIYAAIPWTAGGLGDYHLFEQAPAFDCQDGGLDPTSKPRVEQPEEKRHQQEPNQLGSGTRSADGTFDTGLADLIVNQVAVEQQNTATDPLLDAWQDKAGFEATDECRNDFALTEGGESKEVENTLAGTLFNQTMARNHYYLNDAFNLAALKQGFPGIGCLPGARLEPQFTAPNVVNTGDIVGFDASESTITLDAGQGYTELGAPFPTHPTYTWDFGDGTKTTSPDPPGAAKTDEPSAFHSYRYGGTYYVTLTVTDVGGNAASFSKVVTVLGEPPPAPAPSPITTSSRTTTSSSGAPGSAPSASTTSPVAATTSPSATTSTGMPAPTVYEHVVSHSLAKALRRGLAIRYSVNEQVAGTVEVMLDRPTARRLGIHSITARNLPRGYPRSVVIGYAVLVTTRRGHGELIVRFPKPIAERLEQAQRVKLTVRIVVRNAARRHPKSRTLLSTVVLKA
jgi:hypothetical protein